MDALSKCKHVGSKSSRLGVDGRYGFGRSVDDGCNRSLFNGLVNRSRSLFYGLDCRGKWSLDNFSTGGELGDTTLSRFKLFLQILILDVQGVNRRNDFVKEFVNLNLVVTFAELYVLELLVKNVLCSQQGHVFASQYRRVDAIPSD